MNDRHATAATISDVALRIFFTCLFGWIFLGLALTFCVTFSFVMVSAFSMPG